MNGNDLSELFDRDPVGLSLQDIAIIVERMRQNKAQYELGAGSPVAPRVKAPPKPAKATVDLKDLGLA